MSYIPSIADCFPDLAESDYTVLEGFDDVLGYVADMDLSCLNEPITTAPATRCA